MAWIEQHHELAIAILSPLLLVLGYFYRVRVEKRANLREALFLLLEIWHRMGLAAAIASEDLVAALVARIKSHIPNATISEAEIQAAKEHFLPIVNRLLREHALSDLDGLQDAYKKVVVLVARSHPVYAYKLESASSIKKRLSFLDQYLDEAFQPVGAQVDSQSAFIGKLREQVNRHAEENVVAEMEGRLRGLAWRVSLFSLLDVHLLIGKRRRSLALDSAKELDRWLLAVMKPLMADPNTASMFAPQSGGPRATA